MPKRRTALSRGTIHDRQGFAVLVDAVQAALPGRGKIDKRSRAPGHQPIPNERLSDWRHGRRGELSRAHYWELRRLALAALPTRAAARWLLDLDRAVAPPVSGWAEPPVIRRHPAPPHERDELAVRLARAGLAPLDADPPDLPKPLRPGDLVPGRWYRVSARYYQQLFAVSAGAQCPAATLGLVAQVRPDGTALVMQAWPIAP